MNVPQVVKRLKAASKAYYAGAAVMSDEAFDALRTQLRTEDPTNPFLSATGAPVAGPAKKIKHAVTLGSLENAFTLEDVERWVKRCQKLEKPPKWVICEPKEDGLTVNVSYRGGKFVHAATRGDGAEGEDVTANVLATGRVPLELMDHVQGGDGPYVWDVDIRCEAILSRDTFEKHLKPLGYTNARAAAAGVLRNKKGDLAKHLRLRAFSLAFVASARIEGDRVLKSEEAVLGALAGFGFEAVPGQKLPLDAKAIFDAATSYNAERPDREYESDGFVVKVNHITSQEALGWSGNCPVGCIAIKWKGSMTAETTITGLTTQVGKTGKITPVAQVAPVLCGGVTIQNISLMNWDEIERIAGDQKIGVGAKVKIERSGEVIPRLVQVLDGSRVTCEFKRTESCPSCGSEAYAQGPFQVCANPECPAVSFRKVLGWVKGRNILHLGEATLDALMAIDGPVSHIPDLYRLTHEQLAKAAGAGMAGKILSEIEKSRNCTPAQLLGYIGIPSIGETEAGKLPQFASFAELSMWLPENEDVVCNTLGPVKGKKFINGYGKYDDVIRDLYKLLRVTAPKVGEVKQSGWTGHTFAITGATDHPREKLKALIQAAGGIWKSSIVRGLEYLIQADPDSQSTKSREARAAGVLIISEKRALEMADAES